MLNLTCIRCGRLITAEPTKSEASAVPFARKYCVTCRQVRIKERESADVVKGVIVEKRTADNA